jgi:ABC-type lipoprotein release transport system permease subunit
MATGPGEATIGYGLMKHLGASVGDRVDVHVGSESLALKLVGWYRETSDSGMVLLAPRSVAPGLKWPPGYFFVRTGSKNAAAVAKNLQSQVGAGLGAQVVPNDVSAFEPFRRAALLMVGLVMLISLTNLASGTVLTVRERAHDLALIRTIGIAPLGTAAIVSISRVVLAVIACAVGVPLGLGAFVLLRTALGGASGVGTGLSVLPGALPVALAVIGQVSLVCGVAAAAALLALRGSVAEQARTA